MIRRLLKWFGLVVLVLLALPVLAVILVLIFANLDVGRGLIEQQTARLTGGMVRMQGLAGRFPDALRAAQIQVSDAKGPYVTITNLEFDWSPLKLIRRIAQVDQLRADRLEFSRLPVSDSKTASSSGSFNLPVRVDLRHLHVAQAAIGAPVAGAAATLRLDGAADLPTLTSGTAQLDGQRLDSPGHYAVSGTVTPTAIQATIKANEPAGGLISAIAHLPDLGAISLQASISGPRDSLGTQLGLTAGPLTASASGTVDLVHEAADLAVKAQAPAMTPAPGVSWQSVLVDAKVHGPFTRPDANGTINIDSLNVAGARIGALAANVTGNAGQVQLDATVRDLHIPGPKPDIFAADPVTLKLAARLDAPDRPVTFALKHALVSADGTAKTAGTQSVQAHLILPNLVPLAAAGGIDLNGSSDLDITAGMQDGTATATAKGRVAITGGLAPVPALIGADGHVDLAASLHGQDITLSRLIVNGKALDVTAQGDVVDQAVNMDWTVALADLSAVQASLSGKLAAKGHAGGRVNDLGIQATIDADLTAKGYSSGHITAKIDATGLPAAPHAAINADGTLLDAPLALALVADAANGAVKVNISRAEWKSLQAGGAVSLTPPAVIPSGNLHLDFGRLGDLEPLLGRPIAGQANATLDSDDTAAKLLLTLRNVGLPGTAAVSKAVLNTTVIDPTGHPMINGTLTADGVSAGPVKSMSARLTAKGPLEALVLTIAADAPDVAGGPAKLTTGATADVQDRSLALTRMEASWKQQVLKLLAQANFKFADGVAMDRVRLGFRQAELIVSGSAGSALDLTASLRNLPADIGTILSPAYAANGVITADARLTGTSARPQGTIKLTATGVQQRQGPGRGLPAANLLANVALLGTSAQVDTKLTAGPSNVSVNGSVPLSQAARWI